MTVHSAPTAHVAVIGSGASGVLTAVHLLRRGTPRVTLVERRRLGGAAYRTDDDAHLLNVRAGDLSGLPQDPESFVRWAQGRGVEAAGTTFLPRRLYREYLQDVLRAAAHASAATSRLEQRFENVADITPGASGVRVTLDDSQLTADQVVLAVGNPPPAPLPALAPAGRHPGVVTDPWAPGTLRAIGSDDAVLIVGTGLTGADVALQLLANGHGGPITMVSRGGRLPMPHCELPCPRVDLALPEQPSLTAITRAVATALQSARAHGRCWHGVIDGLRPVTQEIWQGFTTADKDRFLRAVRPAWDRHRHRIAPAAHRALQAGVDAGQVHVIAGTIGAVRLSASGLALEMETVDGAKALSAHALVNCTGPATVLKRTDGLLPRLLARKTVRTDPWGLGIDTDAAGRVIDAAGEASPWLSALGPLRRGTLWESTAIPEIRAQAAALADRLNTRSAVAVMA